MQVDENHIKCDRCGLIKYRRPSRIKRSKYHFCKPDHKYKWQMGKSNNRAKFEVKKMSPSLANIIGVFTGDGDTYNGRGFGLNVTNEDFADETKKNLDFLLPPNMKTHKYIFPNQKTSGGNQLYRIVVYGMNFMDYLIKVTNNKHKVPDEIMNGSKEIKKAFLQGLMDSEGCISKRKIKRRKACSFQLTFGISSLLCYDIQKLFSELGIKTGKMTITKFKNGKYKIAYRFSINLFDYYKSGMGFSIGWKQERLNSYKSIFEKHRRKLLKNPNYTNHHHKV